MSFKDIYVMHIMNQENNTLYKNLYLFFRNNISMGNAV